MAFRMRLRRKASGESENLLRPRGLIFARFKQYFWFLLRVPLLVVSDSTIPNVSDPFCATKVTTDKLENGLILD